MKAIRAQRLSGLIIASIVMAAAGAGFLQTSAQATEIIRIPAGETLEIATDSVSPAAQFSWILTKDRRFQTAQRTRFFQTRIAEPGTYSLDVSIQDTKTGENAYRAFTIVVTEPTQADLPPEIQEPNQQTRSAILSAEPPLIQGVSYLPPSGGMLKLDASKSTGVIGSYSLDLDTAVDTSGDGNPANDKDNEGTLSEKTGSPVYLFALPAPHARIIRLSVSDISDPQTATSDISVGFSAEVPAIQSSQSSGVPQIQNPNSPIIMKPDGMTVSFEASVTEAQGKQVLTEWDFGDRSRSLLEKPSHTYAFPGTYTVSLTVRDITTAAVLYSGTTSVNILPVQTSSSSSSEASVASSSSSSSAGSSTGNGSAGAIVKVGMIVLFLLLLAGGLYALLFWLKRRTTLSIQKTLEKVEETIVKKDPKEEVIDASAPMKMKRETAAVIEADSVTDREKSKTDFRTQDRANVTPIASSGPVPSWLKNTPSPSPAPVTSERPAPAPAVAPAAEPPKQAAPATASTGPVPSWLKQEPQAAAPVPAPKPQTPAPAAVQTPPTPQAPKQQTRPQPQQKPKSPDQPKQQSQQKPKTEQRPPQQKQNAQTPKPQQPAPVPMQPMQQPTAITKAEEPKQEPKKEVQQSGEKPTDGPIAIIQADSISK